MMIQRAHVLLRMPSISWRLTSQVMLPLFSSHVVSICMYTLAPFHPKNTLFCSFSHLCISLLKHKYIDYQIAWYINKHFQAR